MLVILFDIDGTLISTGGAGMASLMAAMREEFGIEQPGEVPVNGRTDRGIARNLLTNHAIEDSEANWLRFRDAYLRNLAAHLPQKQGRVLPGVAELLSALVGRDDVLVGLLTGNVRAGAELKLNHYGLAQHFEFGGFGDEHADRDRVAGEALTASREHAARRGGEPRQVWVVGDTPLDVRCARAIGARAVAVATGGCSADELSAARPDFLASDLSATREILDVFNMSAR